LWLSSSRNPEERERKIFLSKASFMEVAPSNVVLSALKKGEKGDSVIARFYEISGKRPGPRFH
jgi:alpha-mannosidase